VNTEVLAQVRARFWAGSPRERKTSLKTWPRQYWWSHIDMITAVLDFVGAPHENGFLRQENDPKPYSPRLENRVLEKFRGQYPEPLLLFYINPLEWETLGAGEVYRAAPPDTA